MKLIFNKNFSLLFLTIIIVIFSTGTYAVTKYYLNQEKDKIAIADSDNFNKINSTCNEFTVKRLNRYKYVRPIMFVDKTCQSERLSNLKYELNNLFNVFKEKGVLNSASIYLKDYNNNDWIAINETETYSPGSLLKVPALITLLKMSEKNPGFLNKKITFNKHYDVQIDPKYVTKTIKFGESYTVKELMTYMIKHSDNNATLLLNEVMDVKMFKQLFIDFGLKEFDWSGVDYLMTVTDYSEFMRSLYNASYLNFENSDFALSLLSKTDFKEGISKGIPANVNIAEKFGESGNIDMKELHETAIIYLDNKPYIITIMTKGKELEKLPEVIKEASFLVFNQISHL